MKIVIHGRNLELTPALREYTKSKLTRAASHFEGLIQEADVHLSIAKNPRVCQQTAEVTVFANGTVIRAQERSENLYSSIDLVANKLSRQLRRFKERNKDHHHSDGHKASTTPTTQSITTEDPIEGSLLEGKKVVLPNPGVRKKYFSMPPMSINDAREQLDLIDHDFYVFKEKDTKQLQVIYKRNHGGYGLIQAKD